VSEQLSEAIGAVSEDEHTSVQVEPELARRSTW
jgi:hypothetical protein